MVRYEVVNMFTSRPFAGSPLGVVPEADRLPARAMQSIARELNTPETAFVLPPSSPAAHYRVRVFTPGQESPYGGHSSAGTAATLVRLGLLPAGELVQECGPKLLSLRAAADEATITVLGPHARADASLPKLAAACSLDPGDASTVPAAAGFGPLFHYLAVRPDAVARARLDAAQMARSGLADVFVFGWDPSRRTAHARLFAPGYDLPEDPACASAALGLGPWLVDAGWLPASDGTHPYRIRQGLEVDRPALLACTVTTLGGRVAASSVTGRVAPAARGQIFV